MVRGSSSLALRRSFPASWQKLTEEAARRAHVKRENLIESLPKDEHRFKTGQTIISVDAEIARQDFSRLTAKKSATVEAGGFQFEATRNPFFGVRAREGD